MQTSPGQNEADPLIGSDLALETTTIRNYHRHCPNVFTAAACKVVPSIPLYMKTQTQAYRKQILPFLF